MLARSTLHHTACQHSQWQYDSRATAAVHACITPQDGGEAGRLTSDGRSRVEEDARASRRVRERRCKVLSREIGERASSSDEFLCRSRRSCACQHGNQQHSCPHRAWLHPDAQMQHSRTEAQACEIQKLHHWHCMAGLRLPGICPDQFKGW